LMITGKKNWHVPFMLNSRTGYMVKFSYIDITVMIE
jgi:hypothetical protein